MSRTLLTLGEESGSTVGEMLAQEPAIAEVVVALDQLDAVAAR